MTRLGVRPLAPAESPAAVRALLVVGLLLGFVFAHGCHGPDEDHEPTAVRDHP